MLESPTACRRVLAVLGIAGLASACADSVEPVAVASVEVTSPLGALLDVGGTAQLSATAMNPAGEAVNGISFTWTSSNPDVVSVSAAGFSEALGVGTATVRAGAGGVGGSLAIRVVDADLPAISALARDPYMAALVGVPSEDVHARLEAAVATCTTGAQRGHLEAIQSCIDVIETEAMNASDPTDRALLAVLGLFLSRIERLLNL